MITAEGYLHQKVCDYIRRRYPRVLFRTDLGGIRLRPQQASTVKRLNSGRAWPDLFIAHPKYGATVFDASYNGLFIELKAANIYKQDGSLRANPHVEEQAQMLERLRKLGYKAEFAVGFDAARKIIDDYLGGS